MNRKDVSPVFEEAEWTWENARRWQGTIGLQASPAQRLAWLEEVIALAHARGASRCETGWKSNSNAGFRAP